MFIVLHFLHAFTHSISDKSTNTDTIVIGHESERETETESDSASDELRINDENQRNRNQIGSKHTHEGCTIFLFFALFLAQYTFVLNEWLTSLDIFVALTFSMAFRVH